MISRRLALGCIPAALAGLSLQGCAAPPVVPTANPPAAPSPAPYADVALAAAWMQQWIGAAREAPSSLGLLLIARFADPVFFLIEPARCDPGASYSGRAKAAIAPAGYVTSFATIPQVFWTTVPPDGLYAHAVVVHDYMYWDQSVGRDDCDDIFRSCLREAGIDRSAVDAVYQATREGGAAPWDRYARLKASGEKRVLRWLPDDPSRRWDEWSKRPGVL